MESSLLPDVGLAVICSGAAALTVWAEHHALPDWHPSGYTVVFTYLLGSTTILFYGWVWALLTGHVSSAAAFTLIGLGAGVTILFAYRRDYLLDQRTQAKHAADLATMAALLDTDEGTPVHDDPAP